MPGRPKRRAMIARMRAKGGWPWLLEQVASGRRIQDIANELETSRYEFYNLMNKNERIKRYYRTARMIGASARMDDALAIADGPKNGEEDTKVKVARDNLRVQFRRWLASVDDPDTFGKKEVTDVNVTINALHLDALRATVARETALIDHLNATALPAGLRTVERIAPSPAIEDAEFEEDTSAADD